MNQTEAKALRRAKVLILDESSFQRALVAASLRAIGVGAIEYASSAQDAMERGRTFQPDVVLLERTLQDIDGVKFVEMVRSGWTSLDRGTAMVMITARTTVEDVEAARLVGVDEYLAKPFTTNGILLRLIEVLVNRRPFVEGGEYAGPCRRRRFMEDYAGPRRRLFDEDGDSPQEVVSPAVEIQKAKARSKLDEAQRLTRDFSAGDRKRIREMYTISQDIQSVVREIGDKLLTSSAASLVDYIAGVGASPRFDPKVVDAHVEAMAQLLALPHVQHEMREKVALALGALVRKKLAH